MAPSLSHYPGGQHLNNNRVNDGNFERQSTTMETGMTKCTGFLISQTELKRQAHLPSSIFLPSRPSSLHLLGPSLWAHTQAAGRAHLTISSYPGSSCAPTIHWPAVDPTSWCSCHLPSHLVLCINLTVAGAKWPVQSVCAHTCGPPTPHTPPSLRMCVCVSIHLCVWCCCG